MIRTCPSLRGVLTLTALCCSVLPACSDSSGPGNEIVVSTVITPPSLDPSGILTATVTATPAAGEDGYPTIVRMNSRIPSGSSTSASAPYCRRSRASQRGSATGS
jgi:hypothetical protein